MDLATDGSSTNFPPRPGNRFRKTQKKRLLLRYLLLRMKLRRVWARLQCAIDTTTFRKVATLLQIKFRKIPHEDVSSRKFDAGTNTAIESTLEYRRRPTMNRSGLGVSHEIRSYSLVSEADDEESEIEPGEVREPENFPRVRFKRGRDTRRRSQHGLSNYRDGSIRTRKRRSSLTRSRNSPSPSDDESVRSLACGDRKLKRSSCKPDSPTEIVMRRPQTDTEKKSSSEKVVRPSCAETSCQTVRVEVSCQTEAPEEKAEEKPKDAEEKENVEPEPVTEPVPEIPSLPIPIPPRPAKVKDFKKSLVDRIIALGTRRRKRVPDDNVPENGIHMVEIPPEHADGWQRRPKNVPPNNSVIQYISKPSPLDNKEMYSSPQEPGKNVGISGIPYYSPYTRPSVQNYGGGGREPEMTWRTPMSTPASRPYSFNSSNLNLPTISDRSALTSPSLSMLSTRPVGANPPPMPTYAVTSEDLKGRQENSLPPISTSSILTGSDPSVLPTPTLTSAGASVDLKRKQEYSLPTISDRNALTGPNPTVLPTGASDRDATPKTCTAASVDVGIKQGNSLPAINDRNAFTKPASANVNLPPTTTSVVALPACGLPSIQKSSERNHAWPNEARSADSIGTAVGQSLGNGKENGDQLYSPQYQFTSKYYNLLKPDLVVK